MRLLAIDPGPEESAWCVYDGAKPLSWMKEPNADVLMKVVTVAADALVVEQVASMGMAVGEEVFETAFWSGRFVQTWINGDGAPNRDQWHRVKRREVKLHLCGNQRARDANIRQALIDRYGGKSRAIGTKRAPGPLYGMHGDCWQALAVAITFAETRTATAKGEFLCRGTK